MTIINYEITLTYENGSTWFAGGFSTIEQANKWIDEEKTRPYWKQTTTINIVETVTEYD